MYAPHTISLINIHHETPYLTVLRGVMLQALTGRSAQFRGETEESDATLYIPLSIQALNQEGESVTFLPPLQYAGCEDPESHWSLQAEGESAGRASFFVKGEIPEPCTLAEARAGYDDVYTVAGYRLHDYGSPALQHYEVASRISSRYYRYSS